MGETLSLKTLQHTRTPVQQDLFHVHVDWGSLLIWINGNAVIYILLPFRFLFFLLQQLAILKCMHHVCVCFHPLLGVDTTNVSSAAVTLGNLLERIPHAGHDVSPQILRVVFFCHGRTRVA